MSKERARRRTEREREAAVRRAARAAQAERRERRQARRRTLHAATVGRVSPVSSGRPVSLLARRHRQQTTGLVTVLVLLNLVVWVVRGDWPAVLGALVVSALVYPVLKLLLFARN